MNLLKVVLFAFSLLTSWTAVAQQQSVTHSGSPFLRSSSEVGLKQYMAMLKNCEKLASKKAMPVEPGILDSKGRAITARIANVDAVFEYNSLDAQMPSSITGGGQLFRRNSNDNESQATRSLHPQQLTKRLSLYKNLLAVCGMANNQTTSKLSISPDDEFDPIMLDPFFWSDMWYLDFSQSYSFSNWWQSFAWDDFRRRNCSESVESCQGVCNDVSDGINLACAGIGLVNAGVGFACAIGSYIGRNACRADCTLPCKL
jgi:hypothetical protein